MYYLVDEEGHLIAASRSYTAVTAAQRLLGHATVINTPSVGESGPIYILGGHS